MNFVFLLMLLGLLVHEVDAYFKREWRLLYVLRSMKEDVARPAFVYLHIPLVAAIVWSAYLAPYTIVDSTRVGLSIFAIVHAILHLRLRKHPLYEFEGRSHWIIGSTAALGTVYLLLAAFGPG